MDLRLLMLLSSVRTCFCYTPQSTVKELYTNLKKNYTPNLKPTRDQDNNVRLFASMNPWWLMELDTHAQKLSLWAYFTFLWTDEFLTWNVTEYDGVEQLVLKYDEIWHPFLAIGVNYDKQWSLGEANDRVSVTSNGTVRWTPGDIFSIVCVMDTTYYPFDTQECSMTLSIPFVSWSEVDLYKIPSESPLHLVADNAEWHFLDYKSQLITTYKNALHFRFLFRRRATFVVYTTVVPLVLLSVLNACVVLVPVSSGEKGSIAITLFLSYCVYLTTIGSTLPPNSTNISLILLYMTIVQVFSGLAMLYSIFETSLYLHGSHMSLFNCFSCVSRPLKGKGKEGQVKDDDDLQSTVSCSQQQLLNRFKFLDRLMFVICLLFNSIVVIVITVVTLKSIKETLDDLPF